MQLVLHRLSDKNPSKPWRTPSPSMRLPTILELSVSIAPPSTRFKECLKALYAPFVGYLNTPALSNSKSLSLFLPMESIIHEEISQPSFERLLTGQEIQIMAQDVLQPRQSPTIPTPLTPWQCPRLTDSALSYPIPGRARLIRHRSDYNPNQDQASPGNRCLYLRQPRLVNHGHGVHSKSHHIAVRSWRGSQVDWCRLFSVLPVQFLAFRLCTACLGLSKTLQADMTGRYQCVLLCYLGFLLWYLLV